MTLEVLQAEAARQELPLSKDDLDVILNKVSHSKTKLAALRHLLPEGLETAYSFKPLEPKD